MKTLTNKEALDIFLQMKKDRFKTCNTIAEEMAIPNYSVNEDSLYKKLSTVLRKSQRLKRSLNTGAFQQYMSFPFHLPGKIFREKELENKCKAEVILSQTSNINKLKNQVAFLSQKLRSSNLRKLNEKIQRQVKTIRQQRLLIASLSKSVKGSIKHMQEKGTQCNTIKSEIMELKNEISQMQMERECDSPDTDSFLQSRESIAGRPFSEKLRELYYELISLNVGVKNIGIIVKKVLKMVNIEIKELPSEKTVRNFQTELGIISKKQVLEKVAESDGVTMHRDATTKLGHHYYGVQLSTKNETLTLGLKEVCDGKADTYFQCLNDIDLEVKQSLPEHSDQSFIEKVKNCMTDRCATEEKVNKIMQNETGSTINSFKCSVHPLLQFQEAAEKEVSLIEKENYATLSKDVTVGNAIKNTSKLFFKDGTGDPKLSKTFLESKGIKKIPITNFRGTRFNTYFRNALGIFMMRTCILEYLTDTKSSLNFIQANIVQCLQNRIILELLCALGVLYKAVMEPYMRIAMKSNIQALQMKSVYLNLIDVLKVGEKDPHKLIQKHVYLNYDCEVQSTNDDYQMELINFSVGSSLIPGAVSRLCNVIQVKCIKAFSEFLQDGKFFNPSEEIQLNSISCPQNNISVERLMAKLDCGLKQSPNINVANLESRILFQENKTGEWLSGKTVEEKSEIISNARQKRIEIKTLHEEKSAKVYVDSVQILQDRKRKKEESEKRKSEKAQKMENNLNMFGITSSEQELTEKLNKCRTKKEKITFLKTQITNIKTCMFVLPCNKCLTQFSKHGKVLNVEQLQNNFLKLLDLKQNQNLLQSPEDIIGKTVKHTWTESHGDDQSYFGKIVSYNSGEFKITYEGSGCQQTILTIDELCEDIKNGNFEFV